MKINFTKWTANYSTPHLTLICNEDDYQVSFVILNYHWWIKINRKKQMKKLIIGIVAILGMTACEKSEVAVPTTALEQRPSNTTNVVDSMDYTLDFHCDTLNLHVTYLHKWKVQNFMYGQLPTPNLIIGKTFKFADAVSGAEFTIIYQWDGSRVVGDVTGRYLGHTFTDLNLQGNGNGAINMCGWYQGAKYKFRLRNSKGEVVFSNYGTALSK